MNTVDGLYWKGYEGQDYEQFWRGPAKQYLDELEHAIVAHALPGGAVARRVDVGLGHAAGIGPGAEEVTEMPFLIAPRGDFDGAQQRRIRVDDAGMRRIRTRSPCLP